MKPYLHIILALFLLLGCGKNKDSEIPRFKVPPETPALILQDHHDFLERLQPIISYEDSTGIAARELYQIMEFHFKEEEKYVLPPLGVLPLLAKGKLPEEAGKIIRLTEKFRENQDVMLAEHQMIQHFLATMMAAAKKENHPELSGFDKALEKHSLLEEEILFPGVIIIGEYLKLKKPEH
ncbi:hemerythrin domain-containing protein [Salegentibacter sp. F14]